MNKLQNTSKKLDTLFKVLQKVLVIGICVVAAVTLVLTVVHFLDPNAVIGKDFHIVDIGPVTIELAPELAPGNGTILTYVWIMLALAGLCAAVIYYVFGLVRRILKPMTEGRPFDAGVSDHIKKMGYAVLVLGVAQNIGAVIETVSAIRAFDLANFAADTAVRSITANYTFDLSFLVLFFVLLLLSYVFRYGAELQQLSDETL